MDCIPYKAPGNSTNCIYSCLNYPYIATYIAPKELSMHTVQPHAYHIVQLCGGRNIGKLIAICQYFNCLPILSITPIGSYFYNFMLQSSDWCYIYPLKYR